MTGEEDEDDVVGGGGLDEPSVESGADGSQSCGFIRKETDVAGGESSACSGTEEGGEVFSVAMGVIELSGGWKVLVLGDANDEGPTGTFVSKEVGGNLPFNQEVAGLLRQKGVADGNECTENAHGEYSS